MSAETLHLPLGKHAYDIIIGRDLLKDAAKWLAPVVLNPRLIVIADESVADNYLPPLVSSLESGGFSCDTIHIASGEKSKSFANLEKLLNQLLALQPDRRTTLVALGGGVTGDLVGFAASILLRGIDFIQIPTSLLAQVDSSVGGKTGINTQAGKNLVGSFHQPRRVLIDIATLDSLPPREMRAGYAEIVKYGVLGDDTFFAWLEENHDKILARDTLTLSRAIKLCCSMKADLVEWDEKEHNMRALLNLGHTFGHALEAEAGYDGTLVHGEAVAIGMVMAARLSAQLGMCNPYVESRITKHLLDVGLPAAPTDIEEVDWDAKSICTHFINDKKVQNGKLAFVLLHALGEAELVRNVSPEAARNVVESFLS